MPSLTPIVPCYPELLAPMLRSRGLTFGLSAAAALQLLLTLAGLHGWQCPFMALAGCPCPGCGLSRAMAALAVGDWTEAMRLHAMSPAVAAGLLLMVVAGVTGARCRERIAAATARFEAVSGFGVWGLLIAWIYWWLRIVGGSIPLEDIGTFFHLAL